jgi:hypothetical protein
MSLQLPLFSLFLFCLSRYVLKPRLLFLVTFTDRHDDWKALPIVRAGLVAGEAQGEPFPPHSAITPRAFRGEGCGQCNRLLW